MRHGRDLRAELGGILVRGLPYILSWLILVWLIGSSFKDLIELRIGALSVCKDVDQHARIGLPPAIILACFFSFVVGSLLHRWRAEAGQTVPDAGAAPTVGYAAALIVLLAITFLLGYETWAVLRATQADWPITRFIRCANQISPEKTALGAAVMSFLFGRWFG